MNYGFELMSEIIPLCIVAVLGIDMKKGGVLGNAPRPEPVCQNTEAVRLLGRFIYALYLYIHKNSSFLLYFPYTFL